MNKFCIFLIISILSTQTFAQRQANIWYFGQYAGLDFNSGSPIPLLDGKINRWEGVACFSDSLGNLLFYTDGDSVWNKQHLPMHNGFGLGGHESSTECAIIAPLPLNDSLYYIFTVDAEAGDRGLCYSIVNINSQKGLGSVIEKNIQLQTPVSEKVTAVKHQNNKDIWIISHGYQTDSFFVYLLTDTGLCQPPQIFELGTPHLDIGIHGNNAVGYMRAAPDGSHIALVLQVHQIVEIYDFNNSTGEISNPITYQEAVGSPYGVEFSPDISKLYFTSRFYLKQLDISLPTPEQIVNSVVIIDSSSSNNYLGALQLATDGKIYMAHEYQPYLGVINNPSEYATNCNFQMQGIYLNGRISRLGLPNFIQSYFIPPPFYFQNLCFGDTTIFSLSDYSNIDSLTWYFDDPNFPNDSSNNQIAKHKYSSPGRFRVVLNLWKNNTKYTQTRIIQINQLPDVFIGNDTSFCTTDSILISVSCPNCNYLWSDNSVSNQIVIKNPGMYWLKVTNKYTNCSNFDTIQIFENPLPLFDLGIDKYFCQNDSVAIKVNLQNVTFVWSDNTTTNSIIVKDTGYYWLKVTDTNNCSYSDTIFISKKNLPLFNLGKDTIICPNTTIELKAPPFLNYMWDDNTNNPNRVVSSKGLYWLEVADSNYCKWRDSIFISEQKPPLIKLPNDTIICQGEKYLLLAPDSLYTFVWNDFFEVNDLEVTKTGKYILKATNACGTTSDTILITFKYCGNVDIPNIITPNDDGINDIFYIKGIYDANWQLEIYNRWGNLVYISYNYQNNWCGQNQPDGTYYYILSKQEAIYNGFITIVRKK